MKPARKQQNVTTPIPQAVPEDLLFTRTPLLTGDDVELKRREILIYFHKTFSLYESLFECLNGDDAFYARANPLRHPLIFYYGHTSTFFINKLNVVGFLNERIDPHLEAMFAIGVDEMSWDDLNEKHYDWPTPAEVKAYRDKTRAVVDKFIRSCDITLPIGWNHPLWIVVMGIEHERIHLETSAVLIRELPLQHVKKHPVWSNICPKSGNSPENELLPVRGGAITLGKDRDDPLYGWDNEYGRQSFDVKDFRASKYLVSNREFLEFVQSGGYAKRQYWTEEGWNWAVYRKAAHPVFWVKDGASYRYRAMLEEIKMPWDWPVDVNQLEAKAFCNWKAEKTGKKIRLPTEAEWYMLRQLVDTDQPYWGAAPSNKADFDLDRGSESSLSPVREADGGRGLGEGAAPHEPNAVFVAPPPHLPASRAPSSPSMRLRRTGERELPSYAPGNINLEHYMSACPVNEFAFADGFYDIIGNAWQWTETAIDGFPGFEVHPAYDDFSTPTFDGKHNLFKGGCWASTGNYAIKDSRYAFRRHFFQNAGIRYVEGEDIAVEEPNVYETDNMVAMYAEFHYGDSHFGVPNFPKACAEACIGYVKGQKTERALDLGCATGRSAFELARVFGHVDAVDFSARLIQTPVALQKTGRQRYVIQDEGELVSYREAALEPLGLTEAAPKVSFLQGDACNLAKKFTNYDLVFAGNLIDRLYDPALFLRMIHERINAGGFLVLTSPYTWLEDFTERSKWLGGFKAPTGENFTTLDGLKNILAPHFTFVEAQDVPFVIRETRRKFQHTVAELSAWQKK